MNIEKLNKYRFVYHAIFWIAFILVFSLFFAFEYPFAKSFSIIALTAISYMPAVYFNVLYLIPNVLIKQRALLKYLFYVLLTILISLPLVAVVSYYNFYGSENFDQPNSTILLLIGCFINTIFMVILVSGLKFAKEYLIQQQQTMELQRQSLISELRFLKSQINPHFLFNTLNNIYSLTLKNHETAPEAVLKLAELMRYILYECNEREVPLVKEIQCINNYIDLERLRQGEGSNIQININGEPEDYIIAPLLFIPFLENSFKHGLNSQIADSWVTIDIDIKDHYLHLSIANSKGKRQIASKKSGGIGLKNVQRRLDLLYPKNHKLNIKVHDNLYQVDLKVQLKYEKVSDEIPADKAAGKAASKLSVNLN